MLLLHWFLFLYSVPWRIYQMGMYYEGLWSVLLSSDHYSIVEVHHCFQILVGWARPWRSGLVARKALSCTSFCCRVSIMLYYIKHLILYKFNVYYIIIQFICNMYMWQYMLVSCNIIKKYSIELLQIILLILQQNRWKRWLDIYSILNINSVVILVLVILILVLVLVLASSRLAVVYLVVVVVIVLLLIPLI